ncbi:huntingtin-interacting protein 1 [Episyrphus balteatus]|uniref:huntingtin-interacting protein 1 n=1 Tax=Episyrphus balteatus TaxID=286459 RepID=UPI0024861B69|nr:huntingtin-interacting protein 1 [Episyrphus balteatus]XP_055855781.1 huntingtin-interacting protein 1 [Episyrphus balteatus]
MSLNDKVFFQLSISVSKALNPMETPLKLKHARSAIISTHRTKETKSFWAVVTKQPLMENRFTAWKFCHLVHKVLREGHPSALKHSRSHKQMIHEMGKLWGHLQDGVGNCIQSYTKLIVTKLDFHDKNPNFPGSLVIDFKDLERVAGDDINFYFQLGVEIFDYLDDIIALQAKVFTSINTYRMSSMTPQGQCRLAPLIPLIQDSNPLYDLSVRLMFKLHANLPNDILTGHRDRFRTVFNQLKTFYDAVRPLQYFADLIQVPHLPTHAPNFSSSVDFGSYVPPVVVVPPEPEPVVDNLVDVSVDQMQNNRQDTPETPQQIDFERLLQDREEFIRELQFEIERLRNCVKTMTITQRDELNNLEEQISRLNSELANANEELVTMRILKDDLELKLQTAPILEQKATAEQERANITEEKFTKLKNMYTQIREEHINLLRQHAEASKQLNTIKKQNVELVAEKELIKVQLDEFAEKQIEHEQILNKTTELENQTKDHSVKYENLCEEHEKLQRRFDDLQVDKSAEIAELKEKSHLLEIQIAQAKSDANASLETIHHELSSSRDQCVQLTEQLKCSIEEKNNIEMQLQQANSEFKTKNETLNIEIQNLTLMKDELQLSHATLEEKTKELENDLKQKIQQLENSIQENSIKNDEEMKASKLHFETELEEKKAKVIEVEKEVLRKNEDLMTIKSNLERLSEEKTSMECDLQDLLHQQAELESKYKKSLETIASLQSCISTTKIHGESALRALLEACIRSSEKLAIRAYTEKEFSNVAGTSTYFMMLAEELQNTLNELQIVYEKYAGDNSAVEGFSRKIVLTGHLLSIIQIQGMTVCNTSADIEAGEEICKKLKTLDTDINAMFQTLLQLSEPSVVLPKIVALKEKLTSITGMIHDLSTKSDATGQLGDLVESELATMDKAIEEAASKIVELLSSSRASDSGIKLEVNERILDACTNLMQSIRLLVQRAKSLQAEIVVLGKGTASAKEFYKRNNQWSEGLISASKSVATGANLLVEAANKAVSGEAKHHLDIIVAAQEIAACTAQLVVASRVKAPRNSQKLTDLSNASRNVTQATGTVVATAKDCSQHLEDSKDFDLSKLTVHQAKTFEMEIQVKVLELEQALQTERLRLAAFRRKNYRNDCD